MFIRVIEDCAYKRSSSSTIVFGSLRYQRASFLKLCHSIVREGRPRSTCYDKGENNLKDDEKRRTRLRWAFYEHTVAEKVYVHIVQNRQTITRWIESCSLTTCKMFLDARTVAKNDGAY